MPFGTQAAFVIWHGMSMIYSWVLLIALIGVLVPIIDGSARSWRGYVLAGLLIAASSGAKASSLPIVLAALALAAFASLVRIKRVPWPIVILGVLAAAGQFFAIAVLYRFQTYATGVHPFGSIEVFSAPEVEPRSAVQQAVITGGVLAAYFLNMQLRLAGIVPLLRRHRLGLEPAQWLLLGGALGGIAAYMLLRQLADGQQYFVRSGFAFGVILSAWGFVEVFERARLGRRGKTWLGVFAAAVAVATIAAQLAYAQPLPWVHRYDPAVPILRWAAVLLMLGVAGGSLWYAARGWATLPTASRRQSEPAHTRVAGSAPRLHRRGGLVILTAVLVVGAPGLVMDMVKSARSPNGGAYTTVSMPRSRVEAARWVRDHSSPGDVLATNAHCLGYGRPGNCDPRSFWLSAYAERRVLVEGWTFAPRLAGDAAKPFWDPQLLDLNDRAFTGPTAQGLAELKGDGVRWLVADSRSGPVAPELASLAVARYSDGPVTVYELR